MYKSMESQQWIMQRSRPIYLVCIDSVGTGPVSRKLCCFATYWDTCVLWQHGGLDMGVTHDLWMGQCLYTTLMTPCSCMVLNVTNWHKSWCLHAARTWYLITTTIRAIQTINARCAFRAWSIHTNSIVTKVRDYWNLGYRWILSHRAEDTSSEFNAHGASKTTFG